MSTSAQFEIVALPRKLIRATKVRVTVAGKDEEMSMSELIQRMNLAWLHHLAGARVAGVD